MNTRHNNTNPVDLPAFFDDPATPRQRHYETVRAVIKEGLSFEEAARRFGYTPATVKVLVSHARCGRLDLFPEVRHGPKKRRTPRAVQKHIISLRKERLSSPDIHARLVKEGVAVSIRTVERISRDHGFKKLKRRTDRERGVTRKGKVIPERAEAIDISSLAPFRVDCPSIRVFFFLPYLIESGILDVVKRCRLPESSDIAAEQAALSMLLLKLIGNERLSHMAGYDHEPGLGLFAGLTVLPKSTYMCTYSCRTSEAMLYDFQEEIVKQLKAVYPTLYQSPIINLDFHSIPHFGTQSEMERVWCGARGKAMRGANTVLAQDGKSNVILYTRADILRREEAREIKKFVAYWKSLKGVVDETLVFDGKFTSYPVLDDLTDEGVLFITLRRRYASLIEETLALPKGQWKRARIPIPRRKYSIVSVHESEIHLSRCRHSFRQIIVKDHGRKRPTYIITNNHDLPLEKILEVYAKRWHIENKIAELVSFFNLNALSSPLMIRIHFDILWTLIADTLYHLFTADLRRFEDHRAPFIFKRFIDMPGHITYDGTTFRIKIRSRAYTPILKGVEKLCHPFSVPWLDGKKVEIVWTP